MQDELWSPERPETYRPLGEYLTGTVPSDDGRDFLSAHPDPVLVMGMDAMQAAEDDFQTGAMVLGNVPQLTARTIVIPVVKRLKDNFPRFIWIGREPVCDVWLPVQGISKLHAQFTRPNESSCQLIDAGSKNGTFVNGKRLERNVPAALANLDLLQFGPLEVTFYTPEGFWEKVRHLIKLNMGIEGRA
jgi:pSer/pThr/pTyr-binding forkhead associated (FHA) protein